MVLKADQERIRTLLKDTITLLCKNGLTFKTKFSVDALIGVTLDEDDVFLVSIREIVGSEKPLLSQEQSDTSSDGEGSMTAGSPGQRKHRKRKRKVKPEQKGSDDEGAREDDSSEPVSKRLPQVKREVEDEEDDQEEDIVFVKTELDDNWSQVQGGDSNNQMFSGSSGMDGSMQEDQNFSSLSGLDLVPLSQDQSGNGGGGQMMWMGNNQQQRPYRPRVPRTSTVTMPGDQQQQQQIPQQQAGSDPQNPIDQSQIYSSHHQNESEPKSATYTCEICSKPFTWRRSYKRHRDSHFGKFAYNCTYCSQGFMNRAHLLLHTSKSKFDTDAFGCHICSHMYPLEACLKYHLKRDHGVLNHCPR